tara:strand:+ start:57 stop:488 length:432 start_codon:yes stop_codon:yes gene_type:complete
MKNMRYIFAILALATNLSYACTIEDRSYKELVAQANQVFIGSVVEIHWSDFEKHIQKYSPVDKGEIKLLMGGKYTYRVIPHEIWKGEPIDSIKLRGGYCKGALVNGGETYLIMTFGGNSILDSKAFPLHPELIKLVKSELKSS